MSDPIPPSVPLPPREWTLLGESAGNGPGHSFPPRPEVAVLTEPEAAAIAGGATEHDGYWPNELARHAVPELLRPEERRRPLWRRQPGQQDDMGEPVGVFDPDDRAVIFDTAFPWCTCGRVATPGGWGSGVMIGPRHMLTASHVIPWLPGGGSDWLTFTPMQYDTSTPFGSTHVTRVYTWLQVNGGDGIQSTEAAFDYAVCVLNTGLGTGHMGSRGYSSDWNGLARWAHVGYPSDIGSGVRPVYTTNGVMDSTTSESTGGRSSFRIMHRNDLRPGQSGGPYFGWWTGEDFPRVVASQSAENWGGVGGSNAAGGADPLSQLIVHATTTEP